MMVNSKYFKEKRDLQNKFYDYTEPTEEKKYPLGYKLKDDAPEEAKKAFKRYMEILNKEFEENEKEKLPFM